MFIYQVFNALLDDMPEIGRRHISSQLELTIKAPGFPTLGIIFEPNNLHPEQASIPKMTLQLGMNIFGEKAVEWDEQLKQLIFPCRHHPNEIPHAALEKWVKIVLSFLQMTR
jgi:hypothetical protein